MHLFQMSPICCFLLIALNQRKLGKVYLADNDAIRMPLSDLQSEDFCNLLRLFHFDFGLSINCVSQDKKC